MFGSISVLGFTKGAVSLIVGAGTARIVKTALQQIVEPTTIIDKFTINAATYVISSMAVDATKRYTDSKIDEIASKIAEVKRLIDEAKAEQDAAA